VFRLVSVELQIAAACHHHIYRHYVTFLHERYAITSTKILHPLFKRNRSSKTPKLTKISIYCSPYIYVSFFSLPVNFNLITCCVSESLLTQFITYLRKCNTRSLSIVYNNFFKCSPRRWLHRNQPKHVAVKYDVKYIF